MHQISALRSRLLALVALGPFLGLLAPLRAGTPPVQFFYVPFPEDQFLAALQAIEAGGPSVPPANPVQTYISIAAIANGTRIFFFKQEAAYEIDVANPVQPSTQIWGDANPGNGAPPGVPGDVINAGTVIILNNAVDTGNPGAIDFDGRDKVAATKTVAMTRTGWASGSNTLLAGGLEMFDTALWGTDYRVPVGQNIPSGTDYDMFEYTGLAIMALENGTTVQVDADANGSLEITQTLSQGQGYHVNGGVNVGARVVADKPVQVAMITGDVASNYESRDSALLPTSLWSSSYYTPVSTGPNGIGGGYVAGTAVWLYNAGTSPISVTYARRNSSGTLQSSTLTVSAGSYVRQDLPTHATGAQFSTSGAPFYAFSTTDCFSTDTDDNQAWDWGYTLVPDASLTSQAIVGLGIGRDISDQPRRERQSGMDHSCRQREHPRHRVRRL